MSTRVPSHTGWPALPLEEWQQSYAAVHLWTQVVGKTRLALASPQNHWWHCTLYLTTRGLTTSPMPYGTLAVEVELDFLAHVLRVRVSDGRLAAMPLRAEPVAEFYQRYRALLRSLGIEPAIWTMPVEIADPVPFDRDLRPRVYQPEPVQRCWQVLLQAARVLERFRGEFLGKCSPVHFWWGAFDLACTRFSGRPAPPHPGGVPNLADHVTREAYSHECISAGWWPGTSGGAMPGPAFYAYVYPEPPGCSTAEVRPAGAEYHPVLREWVLPYDVVREAPDPDAVLHEFLDSTYTAAANLAGWDRETLERAPG